MESKYKRSYTTISVPVDLVEELKALRKRNEAYWVVIEQLILKNGKEDN